MLDNSTVELLGAYFDGELTGEQQDAVHDILKGNPEARDFLRSLEDSRTLMRSNGHPPEWHSIKAKYSKGAQKKHRVFNWGMGMGLIAGVTAVLVTTLNLSHPAISNRSTDLSTSPIVEMVETDLQNTVPIVYVDEASGWTIVWVIEEEDPTKG